MNNIMKLAQEYAVRYRVNRAVDEARAALEAAVEQQAEEITKLKESVSDLRASTETLARERNALQDKLSAMEKQDPAAWMSPGKERIEFSRTDTVYGSHTIPLYTAPKVAPVEAVEPIWWWYRTNGKYDHFQDRRPDHDAYDEGSLKPLFTSHKLPGPEVQQVIPVDGWKVRIRGTQTYLHVTGIYDDTVYVDLPAAPKALEPLTREDVVGHANSVGFRSAGSCCSVPLKFCSTDMWVGNLLSFVRAIEKAHNIGGQQP